MGDLLEYLVKCLVGDPDAVSVSERIDADVHLLELRVAESDMGRVIGRRGRVLEALRQVMRAAATREGCRAVVRVVD